MRMRVCDTLMNGSVDKTAKVSKPKTNKQTYIIYIYAYKLKTGGGGGGPSGLYILSLSIV